jgi:hypothetical protein
MKKIHINESQENILNFVYGYNNIFGLYESLEGKNKVLLEGLIKSYAPETVARYLSNYFKDGLVRTNIHNFNGVEFIIARMPSDDRYENESIRIMDNLCGYKLSRKGVSNDKSEMELVFEPKFQKPINDEMEEYEKLIHVSPSYNKEKILKFGFCPKFKNEIFNYNDRIYFYSTKTQPDMVARLSLGLAYSKDNERNDHLFDFYMVDPKKINRKVEFHRDGMTANGIAYWTYDNVPSDCIIDINRFRFDPMRKKWEFIE